jgi:tetratricopeptide (TPR) repeat protein
MLAQVSIFGRDVSWDFFGAWQHTSNVGYAHFANHKDVAGMKLWSWGNAGVGVVNQTALTDDGSVYAETQCGAMETQLDFAFLQPGVTRTWREWWIPLRGMGGLTCASALAGARVKLAPAGEAGKVNLVLGVCPAKDLGQASLRVFILGKTILNETANLSPEQPWVGTYTLSAKELAGHPISILVTSEAGEDVLDYTLDRDPSPIVQDASTPASPVQAAQEYYQLGLKHENLDNREQAMDAYYKAIEASAEHGKAYYRLGLMLLRSGSLPEAKELFQKAVARNQLDGNFYLALVNRLEERPQAARGWLRAVPTSSPLYAAALSCQGMLAMSEKDWQKSINLFDQASRIEHHSISATLLLGMAMRRAGLLPAARSKLTWVLSVDPLNHCALREMAQLEPQGKYQEILSRLLADDRQYQIDLACTYLGAGLSEEALDILQEAYQSWSYPMLAYLSAYIEDNRGHASQAADWLAKAGEASPEYVFPSRIEEYLALKCALERNPRDVKAKYYQGNFLYAHQRFEEGVRLWQEALPGMAKFDVIYRNLALAAWLRENNLAEAVGLLEQCLALNPQNQDIYLHLDELYKALGLGEQREQLLHKINALPEPREDVRKRSILILVDRGDYEGALKIMLSTKFVPLEMDQSFHEVYVRGLLQRAEARLQSGDVDDAISDYQKALEFPENLGVGMPTTLAQAHIYYRLGLAYEQLGRFGDALDAWRSAALEHHPRGSALYGDVQQALDKLSRYSELGLEIKD